MSVIFSLQKPAEVRITPEAGAPQGNAPPPKPADSLGGLQIISV